LVDLGRALGAGGRGAALAALAAGAGAEAAAATGALAGVAGAAAFAGVAGTVGVDPVVVAASLGGSGALALISRLREGCRLRPGAATVDRPYRV
jgi:hypothetical protein